MHPAERAMIEREMVWSKQQATPSVAPGSSEEERALEMIEEARDNDLARLEETPEIRRRRFQRELARKMRDLS